MAINHAIPEFSLSSLLHKPQEHAAHLRKEEVNGVLFSSDFGVFCPVAPC